MNPVLENILRTRMVELPDGSSAPLESSVSRQEGEFLRDLVVEERPSRSLEIGLAYGISTLFICEGLASVPGARHVVIDPYQCEGNRWGQSWGGIGLRNLQRAGFDSLIEFWNVPSHRALPQLESQGRKIDFAFIDGWHTYDHTLVEFFYIDKLLRVGGLLVLDDADWPGLRKLCRYIVTNRAYSVHRCLQGEPPAPRSPSSLGNYLRRVPWLRRRVEPHLKPETLLPDTALGLAGKCVALRKKGEDERPWSFHQPF